MWSMPHYRLCSEKNELKYFHVHSVSVSDMNDLASAQPFNTKAVKQPRRKDIYILWNRTTQSSILSLQVCGYSPNKIDVLIDKTLNTFLSKRKITDLAPFPLTDSIIWLLSESYRNVWYEKTRNVRLAVGENSWLLTNTAVTSAVTNFLCHKFALRKITVKWKILLAISMWKDSLFKHQKYQNLWMNNKVRGDYCAICLHCHPYLLNICKILNL